jgi:acetyl esterase
MIYFHGGGTIAGTPAQHSPICNRYAVDCDATIINFGYRLAPEHKAPAALYDAYSCVKWAVDNAQKLGIDPAHICIFGESGGGYVTEGCAVVLADHDEGHLVKFHMPMLPSVNDMYFKDEKTMATYSEVEKA